MGKIWNQGFTESGNITFYDMECCVPGSSGDQMKVWRGYWESTEPRWRREEGWEVGLLVRVASQ